MTHTRDDSGFRALYGAVDRGDTRRAIRAAVVTPLNPIHHARFDKVLYDDTAERFIQSTVPAVGRLHTDYLILLEIYVP